MEPLDENIQDIRETDIALGESMHPLLLLPPQIHKPRNTERREKRGPFTLLHVHVY